MSDESNSQASPSDGHDRQPPTQDFPPVPPPPPVAGFPGQPQWATPVAPPAVTARLRRRDYVLVGLSVVLAAALVVALPAVLGYMWVGDRVVTVQRIGSAAAEDGAQAAANDAQGTDLREAAVFLQSNDPAGNKVLAYSRAADGKLTEVGRYDTGGTGSGSFEDSANGLVLGTTDGEAAPNHFVDKAQFLFASNAGSSSISVFKVNADGLELIDHVPSGGQKPVSITVNHGLLYVLNSGEFDNRFVTGLNADEGLDNCIHGQLPSITGFKVSAEGKLTKINGSTRMLSGAANSGCVQVSFTPNGKFIVVSERFAGRPGPEPPGGTAKGALLTFQVRENGMLGAMQKFDPTGNGPFGFTFLDDDTLLSTEQNGGFLNPGKATVATYRIGQDGSLHGVGESVPTTTTDACWILVTNDKQLAFASAPAEGGTISSFKVDKDGSLTLLHRSASAPDGQDANVDADRTLLGLTDLSLSRDSKFVYQLNSLEGLLYVFSINSNGTLTYIETHEAFNILPIPQGGMGAPFGIAAF
jgi:6-phosphogluconolactonase (cycloisomerase 2 family)